MMTLVPTLVAALAGSALSPTVRAESRPLPFAVRPALKFKITPVQLPAGSQFPAAWGINDASTIVGNYYDASKVHHGFVLQNGTLTNIDDPKGSNTNPLAINNHNATVGEYTQPSGVNHGFLYAHGKFHDIGLGARSAARGINNRKTIVGAYANCASFCADHGFVLSGKKYTTVDVPHAIGTSITGTNDAGIMTIIAVAPNGVYHSYLYDGKAFMRIDVPGAVATYAEGINGQGDVSLSWDEPNSPNHCGLLHNGKVSEFSYPGATVTYVGEVNDQRTIIGTYEQSSQFGIFTATY